MDPNSKPTQSTTELLGTAASLAALAMLARSVITEFLPHPLRRSVSFATEFLRSRFSTRHTVVIEEREGSHHNLVYDAIETYLAAKVSTSTARVNVSRQSIRKKSLTVSLRHGEEMIDPFEGVQFKWRLLHRDVVSDDHGADSVCLYELSFHKAFEDVVFDTYFPHILERSESIKGEERARRLHLNYRERWRRINLNHPATFDTLAIDLDLKNAVIDDLARFAKRKEYYKKIGKAWKRGYLIHGPPGSGKSSLVGAMANYLKFDIYDLELTEVRRNSTLKKLLMGVANKAIVVIEDIDCSVRLRHRDESSSRGEDEKVTLSGLLNFVDGLWSSGGEERIIVFTTNYKDRLDPALLRPGRVDMEIHMDYCGVSAFRTLVSNYRDVDEHPLFGEIEELIGAVKVTTAEVAEELTRSQDAAGALRGLVEFLLVKRERRNDAEGEDDSVSNVSEGKNFQAGAPPAMHRRDPLGTFRERGGNSHSLRGRGGYFTSSRGRGGTRGGGYFTSSRGREGTRGRRRGR